MDYGIAMRTNISTPNDSHMHTYTTHTPLLYTLNEHSNKSTVCCVEILETNSQEGHFTDEDN